MAKPFLHIYYYFAANRKIFFVVLTGFFLLTGFFALKLKPEEDISKILPNDKQSETLQAILHNARFADKLVLMISSNNPPGAVSDTANFVPDQLVNYSDSFANRLRIRCPHLILNISERVNDSLAPQLISMIAEHLPLFLEPGDYLRIDSLRQINRIQETLTDDIRILSSPAGFALKSFISIDPMGLSNPALKKLRQLSYDENFDLYDGHVISKDAHTMLVFIEPAYPADNTGKNAELLSAIDQTIYELNAKHRQRVTANYFGGIAVAAANAAQLKRDSFLTLGITAGFLIIFLSWYFKKKRAPFIILIPVLLGGIFSLAVIYFIKGSISVIALAAGSVVLGIAINYSLHIYNHFRHRRDMVAVLNDLAFPLTIGGLTTIGGFLSLQFVQSEILKDLGLFAAFSLIGASLSSLIFLPNLITGSSDLNSKKQTERDSWIGRIARYHPENNKPLLYATILITIFLAPFVNRVNFDQDMMHMNYMPKELTAAENKLNKINAYSLRSVYLVTEGRNLEDALRKQETVNLKISSLHKQGVVREYSGIFELLSSDSLQTERIGQWNQYWTANKKNDIVGNMVKTGDGLGFSKAAFNGMKVLLNKRYEPLSINDLAFLRKNFADDYIIPGKNKISLVSLLKVNPSDKKQVYESFSAYPDVTVIDKQFLTAKLLAVVTADFSKIGWMVSILVFVVLLLTYGRIELALISFIPMVIAFVWILGIMGIAGIEFNIVNIILSALIFGLGDDYSLFIMDGLLQEYKTGRKNLTSYKSSIVLSAITTLAGLGVLIFAKHPALRSIAIISITGILCVVLIAQVMIPFLFRVLITGRIEKNQLPWTATGLLKSVFSLLYFALGSLIVSAIGLIIVKLNPFFKPSARSVYHNMVSSFSWSVLYIMGNVKKTIVNADKQNFLKPVVMIANHQSFLDILVMAMIHPKMIMLTNNWVWNSPVFGQLVRIAGYYPVSRGIENGIGYFSSQVSKGYSIAVFPEGTRSRNEEITRFHKGAFFIAEKLQLDILPVLIHGTGYTMSKGDFLLKDGNITITFLPMIRSNDLFFGVDYAEKAKFLGRYFRKQYARIRQDAEQPFYFREKLIYNYVYKGPVLEWYLRFKVRLENDYQFFHSLLPKTGRLLDIGCGYGFMSYMLQFSAGSRDITGYDFDGEKIAVARNCFSRNGNIQFQEADVTSLEIEPAGGIILSDVLHYLNPDQQEILIHKCMNALCKGGVLVIRDGDRDLKKRHRVTRLTEFFSTRLFSFNKTAGHPLQYLSGTTIRRLADLHKMDCKLVDKTVYTSNMLFVISHPEKKV